MEANSSVGAKLDVYGMNVPLLWANALLREMSKRCRSNTKGDEGGSDMHDAHSNVTGGIGNGSRNVMVCGNWRVKATRVVCKISGQGRAHPIVLFGSTTILCVFNLGYCSSLVES